MLSPNKIIDYCSVCGRSSEEIQLNIHSAINMPVSLSYCEDCDKKGYITLRELLIYLSNPNHKQQILNDWDFIRENIEVVLEKQYVSNT